MRATVTACALAAAGLLKAAAIAAQTVSDAIARAVEWQ